MYAFLNSGKNVLGVLDDLVLFILRAIEEDELHSLATVLIFQKHFLHVACVYPRV